jgi:hypothetical protein
LDPDPKPFPEPECIPAPVPLQGKKLLFLRFLFHNTAMQIHAKIRIHNTENPNALLQIKLSQISDIKNCQIS